MLMNHPYSQLEVRDVEVAIRAAEEGAAVVRQRLGLPAERVDKGGGDFATAVDVEAELAILEVLQRERPQDAVLAEESGRSGGSHDRRGWLVDPLCGTLNYAVQMRVVAVNVALRSGEDGLCAAVADAFSGEVFWTDGVHARRRAAERMRRWLLTRRPS
jgi:myo-inositol-1(or 4)-monophosphatase